MFKHFFTWESLLTKFFAVMLALAMWIYVQGSEKSQTSISFRLELAHQNNHWVANTLPEFVEVKVVASRVLIKSIKDDLLRIHVDLSGSRPGKQTIRFTENDVKLPLGVKIIGFVPSELEINLEEIKSKKVKVVPRFLGTIKNGLHLIETIIVPNEVSVLGSESKINEIVEVGTEPINLSEVNPSETKMVNLALLDNQNVRLDEVNQVKIFFKVEGDKKTRWLNDLPIHIETEKDYLTNPSKFSVLVEGPVAEVDAISPNKFMPTIKPEEGLQKENNAFTSYKIIWEVPENYRVIQSEPDTVQFKWISKLGVASAAAIHLKKVEPAVSSTGAAINSPPPSQPAKSKKKVVKIPRPKKILENSESNENELTNAPAETNNSDDMQNSENSPVPVEEDSPSTATGLGLSGGDSPPANQENKDE